VPQMLPRPMAEDELIRFFQVIDALRHRAIFLLMLRCGLRVGKLRGSAGQPLIGRRGPSG
jgi:integrase